MERDPVVAEPAFLVLAGDGLRPGGIAPVETVLVILDPRDRLPVDPRQGGGVQPSPDVQVVQQGNRVSGRVQFQALAQTVGPFGGGAGQHRPGLTTYQFLMMGQIG